MTVLNKEYHSNLAHEKEWLEKLKDFCLAQSWTIDTYETDKDWSSGTGFIDGEGNGDDYLFVSSSGFGSQDLVYRMKTTPSGTANSNYIEIGAFTTTAFSTATSLNPVIQTDKFNAQKLAIGLPSATILSTWFFGNNKFIYAPTQIESDYIEHFAFGSIELFDTSETEGNWVGHNRTTTSQHWFDKDDTVVPFDNYDESILYDGDGKDNAGTDFRTSSNNSTFSENFFGYGHLLTPNNYSQARPMQKHIYFVEDDSDGLWFPLGTSWVYRVNTQGLSIGQTLKLDSEEYICFPFRKAEHELGVAVRVL